jgi:hypothetical protein
MKCCVPATVVFGVLAVGWSAPGGQEPVKDHTNIDPATVGVEAVKPRKDPKTGFVVGGKNATELIQKLTEINGRTIAELETDMRPGATSKVGSTAGFLGKDERLLDVLTADNRYVVDELGLTHQALARHLFVLAGIGSKFGDGEFRYHGRRFKVTGMDLASAGYQLSPFHDETRANKEATVHNLENGKKVRYSLLVPHMIERYGFYEGKGTKYRVDPKAIVEVLDFVKARK